MATGRKLSPPGGATGWPYIGKSLQQSCPKNPNAFFTQKTVVAVCCGLLFGMLGFWGLTRPQLPQAGSRDGFVPFDLELYTFSFFMCSMTGALLVVRLLDSAKRHFAFSRLKSSARGCGVVLATLSCSGLLPLLLPENGGSVQSGPAALQLPLLLLYLCLMGALMLVFYGASADLSTIVPFPQVQEGRASENGGMQGSLEVSNASGPPRSRSIRPAVILMAFSCSGLVHLLVPRGEGTGESIGGDLELPVFLLFLSLMVSLVMGFSRISK